MAEEIRDQDTSRQETEEKFYEIPDRIESQEHEQAILMNENKSQRREEEEWIRSLRRSNKEKISDMPPQLDLAYHEFRRLLKDTSTYYTVIKSENEVNVCLHEQDPKYWIYKCSFFINGDFYNLAKILNNDYNERLWNPYLTEIKQSRKLADNVEVFDTQYELELYNFIVNFQSFYINRAWIDRSKFNLIRSSLGHSTKSYANNVLNFDLPLEMFGLRVSQVECSYPKCRLTVIIKLKRRNFLLDKIICKFIKKYLVAFTILRDELEELIERAETTKLLAPVEIKAPDSERSKDREREIEYKFKEREREREREREKEREREREREKERQSVRQTSEKVLKASQATPLQTISTKKPVESIIQQTRMGPPAIYEPVTPEQKKAYEELKKKLSMQGLVLSDEMTKRFLFSKVFNVEESEAQIKKYLEWMKEMKFQEYEWDNHNLFSEYIHGRIIKHIGFDKEGRPIAYFRACNYFPGKSPEDKFRKFFFSFMKWMTQQIKPGGDQYLIIADISDISKENISIGQFTACAKQLLSFYPAFLHKMFIINGGFFVKVLYNAVKPLLKERHRKRLVFCNSDNNEAYDLLKVDIDDEAIPVHLGGKYVDY